MRVVIPLSAADCLKDPKDGSPLGSVRDLVELQLANFAWAGGFEQHHIMVIPTPSQEKVGREMADALRQCCPNVTCEVLRSQRNGNQPGTPFEPQDKWPVSSNNHFALAAFMEAETQEETPWVWYEAGDSFWSQQNPCDRLAVAYQNGNNLFMGCVKETQVEDDEGYRRTMPGDTMMLGVAVYPHRLGMITGVQEIDAISTPSNDPATLRRRAQQAEIERLRAIYKELQTLALPGRPATEQDMSMRRDVPRASSVGEPFDFWLRHSFLGAGRTETNLIADQWNTYNYRIEDDRLICDAGPVRPRSRPRGGIVDPVAVLVHGCKDGTGHKLASAGLIPKVAWRPATPEARLRAAAGISEGQRGSADFETLAAMILKNQEESERRTQKMVLDLMARFAPAPQKTFAGEPTLNGDRNPSQHTFDEQREAARQQFEADEANRLKVMQDKIHLPPIPKTLNQVLEAMGGSAVRFRTLCDNLSLEDADLTSIIDLSGGKIERSGVWVKLGEGVPA